MNQNNKEKEKNILLSYRAEDIEHLEKLIKERTEALELELTDRKKAERKLIKTLNKLERKRLAILNLMEDLKTEIEERKKTEKQLETERNLLLTIIDNIPYPINLKDSEGRYLLNNQKHLEMIGVNRREDAIGKTSYDFFTEENAKEFNKVEKEVLTTGKAIYDIEEHLLHKRTNEMHWHLTSKIPVADENGNLTRVLTISHDITERKNLENKIRESEIFYRTLVDISPDAISIFDLEGNLVYASKKAYKLFEVPDNFDIKNTSIFDWVDNSFHDRAAELIAMFITGEIKQATEEYLLKKQTGEKFWGEVSSGPLTDAEGNVTSFITICRDVTERKRQRDELIKAKEKAEESDRLKTAFLNNISHEIRTPINAISGFTMLLGQPGTDSETMKSYLDIIIKSSNKLIDIVGNIVELSNIEAGLVTLNNSEVNINQLFSSLYSKFLTESNEKGLSLSYETKLPDEKAVIITDEAKLSKILACLIDNAIKFTSSGKLNFGYRIYQNEIEFYVTDTGIGIDQKFHERIFDKFFQVEQTLSRKYEGLGIGLTLAKAYAEKMGGKIKVHSFPGEGSTFSLILPFHDYTHPDIEEVPTSTVQSSSRQALKNILVVEDDENSHKFIEIVLKKQGYNITRARNGKEAIEIIKKGTPVELVLMDLKLPVMDGYEATELIKKMRPDLPVIAQTAYSQKEDEERAIKAGCSGFITKPFKSTDLLELIKKTMDR